VWRFSYESIGERILKIGPHLPKLLSRRKVAYFFETQCRHRNNCEAAVEFLHTVSYKKLYYRERRSWPSGGNGALTNAVILLLEHSKFCLDGGPSLMPTPAAGVDVFSINRIMAHERRALPSFFRSSLPSVRRPSCLQAF